MSPDAFAPSVWVMVTLLFGALTFAISAASPFPEP